ncbi:MAG: hypothetical protein ACREDR_23310 [Blastocatellia bacterium]
MEKKEPKLLWPDEGDWLDLFHDILCEDPRRAERIARIWYTLIAHMDQGPQGVRDARFILKQALRLTYPFTSSCRLAYKHYKLSLSGQVKPADEPRQLLRESIKRARAQIATAQKDRKD